MASRKDPKVHFAKPCVAGTRIPVQNVLELIEEGIFFEQIIQDYHPPLAVEDIKACVRYVVDLFKTESGVPGEAEVAPLLLCPSKGRENFESGCEEMMVCG
ncbi:MAG: DUF433 domain-containing protein [Deltaproteobacteria bacterium]|nr:DUF433 domain-containing protein [Deltaproteobacteria bacterium]